MGTEATESKDIGGISDRRASLVTIFSCQRKELCQLRPIVDLKMGGT
jgi:hypothetical protein